LDKRSQKDMPTGKLLNYIDQFIDLGAQQIDLQGGEPALHPDLDAFVSRIVGRGRQCSIATNGFGAERHIGTFKKCYSVCVSLDGLPDTTNANRGKEAYGIAMKALELMSANRVNVRLHGVLTYRTTRLDIDHLIFLAKRHKTNVNFVYALDTGNKKTSCNEIPGFSKRINEIVSYIKALKIRGEPVTSKNRAIDQVLNWPCLVQDILLEEQMTAEQREKMKEFRIPRCLWGHMACFFNTDGRLYLCPRAYDRSGYFVEIADRTIKEAFGELAAAKKCYMCGQMGDLSYSFNLDMDNLRTWLKF
jgi:MoaA/NifB/PqqE/SkfB family radical SAM enzyme